MNIIKYEGAKHYRGQTALILNVPRGNILNPTSWIDIYKLDGTKIKFGFQRWGDIYGNIIVTASLVFIRHGLITDGWHIYYGTNKNPRTDYGLWIGNEKEKI